jgi:tetraacyldisaccharide 4'-kinase
MRFLFPLLLPFSLLYGLITDLRNFLYNKGVLKTIRFEVFTINVGNLAIGGTGKTPHVEYLIRLLRPQYQIATLSRGYGRRSKGFVLADDTATADTIGDEPMQYYQVFGKEVTVTVGEERALAIPRIRYEKPRTQVILLDDAFQHRSVQPHLNLLLTDYHRLFTRDFPFPAGRLRERRHGARRADAVIVSKCPSDLSIAERKQTEEDIRKYTSEDTPIFFSGIRYGQPLPYSTHQPPQITPELILVSGIANPAPFEQYAKANFKVLTHFHFRDHHIYTRKDVSQIVQAAYPSAGDRANVKRTVRVLTTQKDFVKLTSLPLATLAPDLPFFYLPMEIYLMGDEGMKFDELILQSVRKFVMQGMNREF